MNKSQKLFIGVVSGVLLYTAGMMSSGSAFAKKATEAITVNFSNIKLIVNGSPIDTKAEPFVYKGNVYAPVATIANMLGVGQSWMNSDPLTKTPAVRFESLDRVEQNVQFEGMAGHANYALDYVYFAVLGSNKVVNSVNKKEIPLPQSVGGTLYPVTRMVHTNQFLAVEYGEKEGKTQVYVNLYQLDKGKNTVKIIFSQQLDEGAKGTTYRFSYNEAEKSLTERIYTNQKLIGVKFYQISGNQFVKQEEM
ncbi:stalk domain-containing protein [Brevibacillus formosus]|uniref:stalk domain-containing protein n=1 Tax=Brevibacillus formosus TaxID=54913 RepID=UPI003F1930B9